MRDPDLKPTMGHHRVFAFGTEGLTKREYFAAMAMQGILSSNTALPSIEGLVTEYVADMAIEYADALIDQLNEVKNENPI